MNKSLHKKGVAYVAVLVIVFLVFAAGGCGAAVPTEEYDNTLKADLEKTEAELAVARADLEEMEVEVTIAWSDLEKTKAELVTLRDDLKKTEEQIAGASSAWASLKPKVELLSILIESIETASGLTLYTFGQGHLTQSEAAVQVEDQWERITAALEAIGSADLVESLEPAWTTGFYGAWNRSAATTKHHSEWNKTTKLLIDLVEPDIDSLSEQISP